jgi:hypothetical protein
VKKPVQRLHQVNSRPDVSPSILISPLVEIVSIQAAPVARPSRDREAGTASTYLIALHSSGVIPRQTPTLSLATRSPGFEDLIEKTRAYIHAAKAPATLRAYRTDFEDFIRFCQEHHLAHLPATPTTVALYIADRAGALRSATITQAAMNGVSEHDIIRQTGHKSAEMLARYIRIGEIFTRNAAAGLGI